MSISNKYEFHKNMRKISLTQSSVLLLNLMYAIRNPNVGWEDPYNGIIEVKAHMNRTKIMLKTGLIESLLWACNLLDEQGKFVHPEGLDFNTFVKGFLLKNETFDKDYNIFKKVKND